MRTVLLALALTPAAACSRADTAPPEASRTAPDARFHELLAPHGAWLETVEHGWLWAPATALVGSDFFPYMSDGTWVYTDRGWLFDSLYPWGWATFHYGRWLFAGAIGWAWQPGEVWAPAWVDWRWGGGYVAWAPLPPRPRDGSEPEAPWIMVAAGDLLSPRLAAHLVPRALAAALLAGTSPERAIVGEGRSRWPLGPPPHEIESVTGLRLRPARLAEPAPGSIVQSRVEGPAVHHEPFTGPPRAMPQFTPYPPTLPMHVLNPHVVVAPVDAR